MIPHSSYSVKFFRIQQCAIARQPIICKAPIYTYYIIVFSCKDSLIPQRKQFPTLPVCALPCSYQFPTCNRKMSFCNRSLCTNSFRAKKSTVFFICPYRYLDYTERQLYSLHKNQKKCLTNTRLYSIIGYRSETDRQQISNNQKTNRLYRCRVSAGFHNDLGV